jgi:hypothetical protein
VESEHSSAAMLLIDLSEGRGDIEPSKFQRTDFRRSTGPRVEARSTCCYQGNGLADLKTAYLRPRTALEFVCWLSVEPRGLLRVSRERTAEILGDRSGVPHCPGSRRILRHVF